MAQFAWEGRTRTGKFESGVIEAAVEAEVINRLRAQGLNPSKVARRVSVLDVVTSRFGGKATEREKVVFTRQLATMIDAGLPIVQCLEILSGQADRHTFKRILTEVKTSVEGGQTFSDALKKHPKSFDDLYTNLIAAGEAGGILDRILQRLAGYIEKSQKLKGQIRGAMIYPAAILVIAISVVIVMLWKVIPVFEAMFKEFNNAALPGPTQFVVGLSHGFIHNAPIIIVMGILMVVGFGYMLRTPKGRRTFDMVILKVWIFGPLLQKVAVARFCRTLGTLLTAGVPILDALDIVAKTAGNVIVSEAILHARTKISEGRNIAEPLNETKVFPRMVVQMIGVGEQTGNMDGMLSKIADFYDDEVDVAVTALTKLMEPLMMVFLGGIVGGLLLAMYLPIFELAGNIKA